MSISLHEYPSDWNCVIASAVIRHNLWMDINDATDHDGATNIMLAASGADRYMKDHWGADHDELVFEPYGDHDADAMMFAEFIGLRCCMTEKAEWNSGCRRYRFEQRRDEWPSAVLVMAELIAACNWEFSRRCKAEGNVARLAKSMKESTGN